MGRRRFKLARSLVVQIAIKPKFNSTDIDWAKQNKI